MAAKTNKRVVPILIDGFRVDATLSETHTFDTETTDYPVERGPNVTDHSRPLPIVVSIEGVVTNTPAGQIALIRLVEGEGLLPSEAASAKFQAVRDARQPIPISTAARSYDDMLMTSYVEEWNVDAGNALMFSMSFKQAVLVTNERAVVRADSRAKRKRDMGHVAGTKYGLQTVINDNLDKNVDLPPSPSDAPPVYTRPPGYVDQDGRVRGIINEPVPLAADPNAGAPAVRDARGNVLSSSPRPQE